MRLKTLLLLPLLTLSLAGCEGTESSSAGLSETPSAESAESAGSVSAEEREHWNDTIRSQMETVLGYELPFLENDRAVSEKSVDDHGFDSVNVYCYYDNEDDIDTHVDSFAVDLKAQSWVVTEDTLTMNMGQSQIKVVTAYRDINQDLGITMSFLHGGKDNVDCLGIFASTYIPFDEHQWPSNVIEHGITFEIPAFTGERFVYDAFLCKDSSLGTYVTIQIKGGPTTILTDYEALLHDNGWKTSDHYDGNGAYYGLATKDESRPETIEYFYEDKVFYIFAVPTKLSDLSK